MWLTGLKAPTNLLIRFLLVLAAVALLTVHAYKEGHQEKHTRGQILHDPSLNTLLTTRCTVQICVLTANLLP